MFFQMELVGGKIGRFYESNKVNEPITKVPLKEIKSKMNFFLFQMFGQLSDVLLHNLDT